MPTATQYETKGAVSGDTITGSINGSNTAFVISNTPTPGTVRAFVNGFAVIVSSVSGTTVTLAEAPLTGSLLLVVYELYSATSGSSVTAICNITLVMLGAEKITGIDDGSPNAVKLEVLYDTALNDVLSEIDWRFARLHSAALTQNGTTPTFNWLYAYDLPGNFLRLCRPDGNISLGQNPVASQVGSLFYFFSPLYSTGKIKYDYPVYPPGFPYAIEAMSDDTFVLLTDYDNTDNDIYINYIRNDVDPSNYPSTFTMTLAYKLAELAAIPITHSDKILRKMEEGYVRQLYKATTWNNSLAMVDNETGDDAWERAGR